jgi:hypothetical protein
MTQTELKRTIDRKFGSYHNFARLVGLDALSRKTPIQVREILRRMKGEAESREIPAKKLEALKSKLEGYFGGVPKFCSDNGFSKVSVYQVLQGRRKRMSPLIARLFKHFGI